MRRRRVRSGHCRRGVLQTGYQHGPSAIDLRSGLRAATIGEHAALRPPRRRRTTLSDDRPPTGGATEHRRARRIDARCRARAGRPRAATDVPGRVCSSRADPRPRPPAGSAGSGRGPALSPRWVAMSPAGPCRGCPLGVVTLRVVLVAGCSNRSDRGADLPDGQRSFVADRGAADHCAGRTSARWFAGADVVHLPIYSLLGVPLGEAGRKAIEHARGAGAAISIDLASIGPLLAGGRRAARTLVEGFGPDILFATAAEADAFLGADRRTDCSIRRGGRRQTRREGRDGPDSERGEGRSVRGGDAADRGLGLDGRRRCVRCRVFGRLDHSPGGGDPDGRGAPSSRACRPQGRGASTGTLRPELPLG